jgi:integrase
MNTSSKVFIHRVFIHQRTPCPREVITIATSFDGKTADGIYWSYLRGKNGKVRKDSKGREVKSYTWRYRDAQGKSKQITSRNLQDIRIKRDEIRDLLNKGAYVDPRRADITLRDYAERWVTNRKAIVGHSTWSKYRQYLDNAVLPELGDYRLRDLDPSLLEAFVSRLRNTKSRRGTKLTGGTVKQYWTCLSMIIQDAIDKGILVRDPRNGVNKGKWDWAKKRYPFEPHEVEAIKAAAYDHSDFMGNLVTIAAETGMRIGEILGTCEDQIDWTDGKETLRVDRQLARHEDGRLILKDPKSASSIRTVPLSVAAVKALRALLDAQPEQARTHTMPRSINDGDPVPVTVRMVFARPDGTPTTHEAAGCRWRKIVKAAGARPRGDEKTGIHRMRHTYAGNLIVAGVDLYVVSKMLGHRSIQVTEMFYAHLRPEVLDTVRTVLNGGATVTTLHTAA